MDESLVDLDADPGESRPSMREWSPIYELCAAMFDRLNSLIQIQAEKNLRLQPWPGPVTAADAVRQRERERQQKRVQNLIAAAKQRYEQQQLAPQARGFYRDQRGRWHRADGRFVSAATVSAATQN